MQSENNSICQSYNEMTETERERVFKIKEQ